MVNFGTYTETKVKGKADQISTVSKSSYPPSFVSDNWSRNRNARSVQNVALKNPGQAVLDETDKMRITDLGKQN